LRPIYLSQRPGGEWLPEQGKESIEAVPLQCQAEERPFAFGKCLSFGPNVKLSIDTARDVPLDAAAWVKR
jgi:hypothetical protein